MATTVRPRGPLPARVYWTRRLVVLGIPLLLVVVLARALGGSSDAKDDASGTATQAGATVETTPAPAAGPTSQVAPGKGKKGKKGKKGGRGPTPPKVRNPLGAGMPGMPAGFPDLSDMPKGLDELPPGLADIDLSKLKFPGQN